MEPVEFQIESVSGTFRDEYRCDHGKKRFETSRKRYETNDDADWKRNIYSGTSGEDQLKETVSMM